MTKLRHFENDQNNFQNTQLPPQSFPETHDYHVVMLKLSMAMSFADRPSKMIPSLVVFVGSPEMKREGHNRE